MTSTMINEHGIHCNPHRVDFGKQKGMIIPTVEIRVGEHEGKFFLAVSLMLKNEGCGSGVSVNESKFNPSYPTQSDAIEAAKRKALKWLQDRVDSEHCRSSDKQVAQQAIAEIKAADQLTLF